MAIIHLLPIVYSGTHKLYLVGLYVIHILPIATRYQQDIPVIPLPFLKKGAGKNAPLWRDPNILGFIRTLQKTIPRFDMSVVSELCWPKNTDPLNFKGSRRQG